MGASRRSPRTSTHACNGHKLTVTIAGDKRFFSCPTMPDLAQKYDGCADASEAIEEFERRATAGETTKGDGS